MLDWKTEWSESINDKILFEKVWRKTVCGVRFNQRKFCFEFRFRTGWAWSEFLEFCLSFLVTCLVGKPIVWIRVKNFCFGIMLGNRMYIVDGIKIWLIEDYWELNGMCFVCMSILKWMNWWFGIFECSKSCIMYVLWNETWFSLV